MPQSCTVEFFLILNYFRQAMMLREGNDFSRVCLSLCSPGEGGSHVAITHDALDLTIQGLLPSPSKLLLPMRPEVHPSPQDMRPWTSALASALFDASDIW